MPHSRSSYTSSTVSPQAGSSGSFGGIVLLHSYRAIASSSAMASGSTVASGATASPYSHSAVASASGDAVV